ncbi:MAG: hypothetical protein LBK06_00635, partial [Planctomycetaceae bacterium]|nr:hypothetical protein [Planctomycetaceae bacterium]
VRTNEDAEYCDFVIHCNESGIIPTRILHFAYRKALNAERNQRFERFQKNLEYICEHEKINLKPDKTKTKNKKTNFSLFKTSAIQSIFRFK